MCVNIGIYIYIYHSNISCPMLPYCLKCRKKGKRKTPRVAKTNANYRK